MPLARCAEQTQQIGGIKQIAYKDRFTPGEKKAWAAQRDEEVRALCAQLDSALGSIGSSEHYKWYLKQMARFHDYSSRNTFLIGMQDPKASLVASFSTWKAFGRSVNKGEKGIRILAPVVSRQRKKTAVLDPETGLYCRDENGAEKKEEREGYVLGFRAVSVFDVRQTSGEPIPMPTVSLTGDVAQYQKLTDAVVKAARVSVSYEPMEDDVWGMCRPGIRSVVLRPGMSQAQEFKTLLHEIAHCDMHPPRGNRLPREVREVQAESAAYVVAAHFGIYTSDYSLGYIDSWTKGRSADVVRASFDAISRFAGSLISRTERLLGREPLAEIARARQQKARSVHTER